MNLDETIEALKSIGTHHVLIPSIAVMELYRGMHSKVEMTLMQKKLANYNVLHINEEISSKATELVYRFKLSHNLDIPDAIIAATCLVYDTPLFTYNTKDFKFIPEIKLHQPSA